ncbi:MAG TPA: FAD-dependent oxidoreductase, partial [Chthonomonadaceae bacterium]|nr:FAD-dependent oxidoreductase [Chthonomonadaceae bacterium]
MRATAFPVALSVMLGITGPALALAPTAPRSFEAVAVSPMEIHCYWLPAAGAAGYILRRDGAEIAELPATAVEYDDRAVQPGSTHRYAIVAAGEGDDRPLSAPRAYTERSFDPFPASAAPARGRKGAPGAAQFDVVIVQASSGGVAAAIEAGRRGLRTALIEPTTRVGGMPVNGLS